MSKFVRRPVRAGCREFHACAASFGKGEKSKKPAKAASCKDMGDICKNEKASAVEACKQKTPEDKKKKKDVCAGRKPVKLQKKKKKEELKDECEYKCIQRGKCDQPITGKPPKMEYKPFVCPSPKFASPAPCPEIPEAVYETNLCPETPKEIKKKKEICVPPPMPKPPTDPVILCPCPTPLKIHPGPCPCYNMNVKKPSKSTMPPCPRKQYICDKEEIKQCAVETLSCKKRKTCDPKKRKKKDE